MRTVPGIGLVAAMAAGAFVAYILALACIRFKADQVVTGTAQHLIYWLAGSAQRRALFLPVRRRRFRERICCRRSPDSCPGSCPHWRILSEVSAISLLALVLALLTRYVLYRTPFGLRLRRSAKIPRPPIAAGVGVNRIRYAGVVFIGVLAGIGGAYLSIGQSSLFTRNMAAGRGFIALAA